MAKNTHAQEVSTGTSDSYTEEELSDPAPPVVIQRAMLGELKEGDSGLVGMDSSELSEKEQQPSEHSKTSPRELAQTTENPSDQTETDPGDSIARTTGGAGPKTVRRQSVRKPKTGARVRAMNSEDDDDFE